MIDFKKAFDTVSRNFKFKTLQAFGITSYIPANNKIQIRGVDVKRFGLDSSRNHSVVNKDIFLLIKKIY